MEGGGPRGTREGGNRNGVVINLFLEFSIFEKFKKMKSSIPSKMTRGRCFGGKKALDGIRDNTRKALRHYSGNENLIPIIDYVW